jgi:hypothetical protein
MSTAARTWKPLTRQPPPPALAPLAVYRFTVEQYHRMIEAGILGPDDRVELLEGWIVPKMPQNPPHSVTIKLLDAGLTAQLPAEWITLVQAPITTRDSEPEPDLAVVRGPIRRYMQRHPGPAEIGLVIEVADSTLHQDRQAKAGIYARAHLSAYWVVNIVEAQIEVYTEPRGGRSPGYRNRQDYRPQHAIPLVLGGKDCGTIPVRDLLP